MSMMNNNNPLMNNNNNNPAMQIGSAPARQGALGGQGMGGNAMGMNQMMNPMMMQQMAAMQQMQQQRSAMNQNMGQYTNANQNNPNQNNAMNMAQYANANQNNPNQNNAMNPMMMQRMAAMQMQNMAKMQQMAMQQQQQQKKQQQAVAAKNKKLAGIAPVAAQSPKAMELQKLQMEKMKAAMENQMQDLQRTGRSALTGDQYQIESILTLFGVASEALDEIIANFTKHNITDSDLKNLDLTDAKLLRKLIPNTKDNNYDEIRQRFITWIRYDIKQLHIHENIDYDEKKQDVNDSVITLNISGVKYTTLKSTLLKTGSSFFQRIFMEKEEKNNNNNNILLDNEGAFFIDRNGRLFEPILRFLQTNELNVKINEWYSIEDVFEEMKYYDIQLPAQYDNKNDEKWLPDRFRFEYCCMYNQLRQFFVSQFRIVPKIDSINIIKKIGALPKDLRDIEAFLEIKQKLLSLGYELKDMQVFRGDPSQWVWTYVEFYQRIKWTQK